jgi:hypothetical protein
VRCISESKKTTLGDGDEGGDVGGDDSEGLVIDPKAGSSIDPSGFSSVCLIISTTRLLSPGNPVL